jgi:hypothetical protein
METGRVNSSGTADFDYNPITNRRRYEENGSVYHEICLSLCGMCIHVQESYRCARSDPAVCIDRRRDKVSGATKAARATVAYKKHKAWQEMEAEQPTEGCGFAAAPRLCACATCATVPESGGNGPACLVTSLSTRLAAFRHSSQRGYSSPTRTAATSSRLAAAPASPGTRLGLTRRGRLPTLRSGPGQPP